MMKSLRRGLVLALSCLVLSGPAKASDLSEALGNMTAEEREIFRQEVRRYLLENPEVIREAIDVLEQRRLDAEAIADAELVERYQTELLNDGYSYVGGNPEGDVTIVEFSDYRCGFCKRAHPAVKDLLEADPNVRLVVKEFPILGPDSIAVARMALAALELDPESFGALNDALMGFQGDLSEGMAYRIARQVGYDTKALSERAQERDIEEKIATTYELARTLSLQGTPSFVIGREVIRGFIPLEDMIAAVNSARRNVN